LLEIKQAVGIEGNHAITIALLAHVNLERIVAENRLVAVRQVHDRGGPRVAVDRRRRNPLEPELLAGEFRDDHIGDLEALLGWAQRRILVDPEP
jgi:hypothetical protein